ncbi:DUF4328 domain-containing protein [Brevundimonas sp. SORGH_AS_0993]|uniref:DUF4328 domain-containing protein n=1 Tax=Brevundimonas sp. SORGH_AS_0993 TaxID=3041794 RepID=UPI0027817353|nr:DUF4328 domain-containing protein [Brevundimonas sp. SORGH_AS_0993]MDQ1154544.1 heme/copper-type cytochrome/quinol oxidase subunit 2 [Brevundimonas sp. SORGH_AS_0993]
MTEARPIRKLTKALRITLAINIVASAGCALGYGLHAAVASRYDPGAYVGSFDLLEGAQVADLLLMCSGLALLPVGLVAGFLALKWSYRSNANAHVFSRGLENTPQWAIWWWFIPFAALFKPFAVISEVWRAALQPDRWKPLKDPVRLRWWWAAHLLTSALAIAGSAMERSAATASQVVITDIVSAAGMLAQVISTLLYLSVIGRIEPLQTALIAQGRRRPEATNTPSWAP